MTYLTPENPSTPEQRLLDWHMRWHAYTGHEPECHVWLRFPIERLPGRRELRLRTIEGLRS